MIESKPRARYTLELKLEALKLVKGAGDKPVSPEQMELARLRAENARLRMERDILGKATAYFARVSK
jgi:transposase